MTQYNPENERMKLKYFDYETQANGKNVKTVDAMRKALLRYEEFTGYQYFKTFDHNQAIQFKSHLLASKNCHGKQLSLSTVAHTLKPVQTFLKWLSLQPNYKSHIRLSDIEYLNLSEKDRRSIRPNALKNYPSKE